MPNYTPRARARFPLSELERAGHVVVFVLADRRFRRGDMTFR